MEPFEGGPGQPPPEKRAKRLASRTTVMEITARVTAVFILALIVIGSGGLLMLGAGWQSYVTWALLVFPLLLVNGVLLRKMRKNRHAKLAERLSKLSVILIAIGAIGFSILAAVVSFVYCSTVMPKVLFHR